VWIFEDRFEMMMGALSWINGDEGFGSTTTQKRSSNFDANLIRMNPKTPKIKKKESINSLLFGFIFKQINEIIRFMPKNETLLID